MLNLTKLFLSKFSPALRLPVLPVLAAGVALCLPFAPPAFAAQPEQEPWVSPNATWETLGPPNGTLLIAGGLNNDSVYKAFLDLVDDPEALIVFISTANDTLDERNKAYTELVRLGAKNVVVLHTHDPREANSEAFVEPLRRAKAAYMSGGYQKRLAQSYLHTLLHRELFALLDRGGVIGGSSAGASIQGSYLVGGGREYREGLGLVRESAIGQHYFRRKRMGTVGRIVKAEPELIGVGIDEATAIVVRGNEFEVVGDSKVGVYDTRSPDWDVATPQVHLFAGDRYDLAAREVTHRANPRPTDIWDGAAAKWQSPAEGWRSIGPEKGQLLIYGGKPDAAAYADFISAAGGNAAPIVVLSSGNAKLEESRELAEALREQGATDVTLLHTIDRDEANSVAFTAPLRGAKAVWVAGWPLWRYADSYGQTLAHKELFGVLDRGGIVGGSGAAAGLLGARLFDAGYKWTEGYGLLQRTLIFANPQNEKRVKSVSSILKKDDELIGIGVAPRARLSVRGDRFSVSGEGEVRIYGPAVDGKLPEPRVLKAGDSLELDSELETTNAARQQ